jgi:glutathione S-transferase
MHLDYWDNELSKAEWFAGNDFTAADIMMSFPLEAAAARADAKSRPMVKAFLDRIHARPAYQAALKTGGQYDYAN